MNKIKLWLPVVLWGLVIFTFSSMPTIQTTQFFLGDFLLKKTAHIMEYGILASLVFRALIGSNIDRNKAMWYSVMIAMMYGITDEYHQSFVPGRGPTVRDVLIDTIGAFIFIYGIVNNISKMPEKIKHLFSRINLS